MHNFVLTLTLKAIGEMIYSSPHCSLILPVSKTLGSRQHHLIQNLVSDFAVCSSLRTSGPKNKAPKGETCGKYVVQWYRRPTKRWQTATTENGSQPAIANRCKGSHPLMSCIIMYLPVRWQHLTGSWATPKFSASELTDTCSGSRCRAWRGDWLLSIQSKGKLRSLNTHSIDSNG